jgi:cbb3-type cytochrome oxidase maturation protein
MEVLYFLLPLSLAFVALIGGILWWAVFSGQYDDPDDAAHSILNDIDTPVPQKTQTHSSNLDEDQIVQK